MLYRYFFTRFSLYCTNTEIYAKVYIIMCKYKYFIYL